VTHPVPWLEQYAARKGLRYTPDADERWLRVWEPYATLKTPIRYEHVLEATGDVGSITVARMVVIREAVGPDGKARTAEASCWLAVAQDVRITHKAATTCDVGNVFGEPLDLVPIPRKLTGDRTFDYHFASFAETEEIVKAAITPSLRKLLLGWRIPVQVELRPGGFVMAPTSLGADPESVSWLLRGVQALGEKASKRPA
jgi:hypothetical protein